MLFKKAEKRLDELYRQNQQGLYTVALAITKDEMLAEDAIQTAFCKLYRTPKPARNLKAYAFQMVRNAAVDQLRTASRFTGVDEIDIFASTQSADESAAAEEERRLISAALAKLNEDQRETIIDSKESFDFEGKGSLRQSGGLSYPVTISSDSFRLEITAYTTNKQFIVEGKLRPKEQTPAKKAKKFKQNLTDLKPTRIELARDEKTGRRLLVNLTPDLQVEKSQSSESLSDSVSVASMRFDNSAVIVNDKQYAGRISGVISSSAGTASLANVNITGVGKVEFALTPFGGAEVIGRLEGTHIELPIRDSVTVDIYGVRNADFNAPFPEGAYHVWGRVSDKAKYADLELIKELIKKMDPDNPRRKGMKKILEAVKNDKPTVMGYGFREIPLN